MEEIKEPPEPIDIERTFDKFAEQNRDKQIQ
jgi:hypothetical protein